MPKLKINWVNDHTQICDRLNERVQLMEDYLDSKPDDFDGIAVKRFLLHQAREQVSWYRQSIDALDYVGCIACRCSLESGQGFLEHYLPAYNVRDTERGTECTATGNSGHSLRQDCGIISIYLKGVSDGETQTKKLHSRV